MHSVHCFADFGLPPGLFSRSVSFENRRGDSRSERFERRGTAITRNPTNNLVRGLAREFHRNHGVVARSGIQTFWSRGSTASAYRARMVPHSRSSTIHSHVILIRSAAGFRISFSAMDSTGPLSTSVISARCCAKRDFGRWKSLRKGRVAYIEAAFRRMNRETRWICRIRCTWMRSNSYIFTGP